MKDAIAYQAELGQLNWCRHSVSCRTYEHPSQRGVSSWLVVMHRQCRPRQSLLLQQPTGVVPDSDAFRSSRLTSSLCPLTRLQLQAAAVADCSTRLLLLCGQSVFAGMEHHVALN